MRFFITLVFCAISFFGIAGNVTIKGHAKGFENATISLLEMKEAVSERLGVLAKAQVNAQGEFYFNIQVDKLTHAVLRCNWQNAPFWIRPNTMYEVVFPKSTDALISINNKAKVPLVFKKLDKDDPNIIAAKLNTALDKEMDFLFESTTTGRFKGAFSTFEKSIQAEMLKVPATPFAQNKTKYALGGIEAEIRVNKKKIFDKYLAENTDFPIWEPDFAHFFKAFFKDYLGVFEDYRDGQPILTAMMGQIPVYRFLELLEKDDFLKDPKLREMVAIWGVFDSGRVRKWDGLLVSSYLEKFVAAAKYPETKVLAQHLSEKWAQSHRGGKIEGVHGYFAKGEKMELDPGAKDLTLYCFGISSVDAVIEDLIILRDLSLRFSQQLAIQYISLDKDLDTFRKFSKDYYKIGIPLTHYNHNEDLMDRLGLISVPSYILVNKDGRKLLDYCPRPSEGLDLVISETIIRQSRRENGFRR